MNSIPFSNTKVAIVSVLAIIFVLVAGYLGYSRIDTSADRIEISPTEMSERTNELFRSFGYRDRPAERWSEYRFEHSSDHGHKLFYVERQSLDHFSTVIDGASIVSESRLGTGERLVVFDSKGRMVEFAVRFPKTYDSSEPPNQFDWNTAFAAAGLELAAFTAIDPAWTPLAPADSYAAWTGKLPDSPDISVRVEGSTFRGQLTNFKVVFPWIEPEQERPPAPTTTDRLLISLSLVAIAASFFLIARRVWSQSTSQNLNARSPLMLAMITFVMVFIGQIALTPQVPAFGPIIERTLLAAMISFAAAALVWALFVVSVSFLSQKGGELITSLNSIANGVLFTRSVGNDILIGVLGGSFIAASISTGNSLTNVAHQLDSVSELVLSPFGTTILDIGLAIVAAIFTFFLFSILCTVVRELRLAGILMLVLLIVFGWFVIVPNEDDIRTVATVAVAVSFVVSRFGLLSTILTFVSAKLVLNGTLMLALSSISSIAVAIASVAITVLFLFGVYLSLRGSSDRLSDSDQRAAA